MTPRILVVDHHDSYTFNLVHLVAGVAGSLPDVVQHDDPGADVRWRDGYTHIVLSPGPGTVNEIGDFSLGREVINDSDVPVLGVCLGMQGIVQVLGGTVEVVEPAHGEVAAVSHTELGLFAGLPQDFSVVRYHSQAATKIPTSLRVTAWCAGPSSTVVMAVEHATRPLYGVQFHPESILSEHGAAMIANFLAGRHG